MSKKIISIEKPKIKKSITDKLKLPQSVEEEGTAKISLDSRKQFFVRFPSVVAEIAKITQEDKVYFKVIAPIKAKNKNEVQFEMRLIRGSENA